MSRRWTEGSTIRVVNDETGYVLGDRVRVAGSIWSRGRGLMLRPSLSHGEGLLIDPCSSIHTMWMRFPIDVLYLDDAGTVVRTDVAVRPWRLGPLFTGGRCVLELPAGTIESSNTQTGHRLSVALITS